MLGKIVGRRSREQQRMRFLDGITGSLAMSLTQPRLAARDCKLPDTAITEQHDYSAGKKFSYSIYRGAGARSLSAALI